MIARFIDHRLRRCFTAVALCGALSCTASAQDYSHARQLFKSGQYDQCVAYTDEAMLRGSTSENWPVLKIEAELATGRYADALATLDNALAVHSYSIRLRWLGIDVCRHSDQTARADALADEVQQLIRQSSWRYRDTTNQLVLAQFFLSRGADAKQVLDDLLTPITEDRVGFVDAYLAIGRLALDKHDYALAAENFRRAAELDPTDPEAQYGLAMAFAPSDADRSRDAVDAALQQNPSHVPTLLLIADRHIDAENYDQAEAALEKVLAVNPRQPLAWAYRAVIAQLLQRDADQQRFRQTALAGWKQNPQVDHLIGSKLSRKYRFAEGAAAQRRALSLDASYLPAKMQLAQDLLRLGNDLEGWNLADEVQNLDGYNVVAHNLATLRDNLAGFQTLQSDGLVVRMDRREAAVYGQRVIQLLQQARQELCSKYEMEIATPVFVEIFPRQQDFAIRTFGLPGGAGYLGVCFGRVITMNSPAAHAEHISNWESVLWHEFCHVVTLQKTNNRMPRWLSEGISVYEERQANPAWGQSMNPAYREMILGTELIPLSGLSGAFLNPPSPAHLQFAYYQSSLVVEYLIQQHGLDVLNRILVDLGVGMPIDQALARYAGSVELLDREFAEFARQQAREFCPRAHWEKPPETEDGSIDWDQWLQQHPNNYWALKHRGQQWIDRQQWEPAIEVLQHLVQLNPHDTGREGAYAMLAKAHREAGDVQAEQQALEQLAERSADHVDAFSRLLELAMQQQQWELSAATARRILAVAPMIRSAQQNLAEAARQTGDDAQAVDALRALAELDPFDPAETYFQLAAALQRTGQLPEARRAVLKSLEEAPRYRAAHRLLLQLAGPPESSPAPGDEDEQGDHKLP